MHLLSDKLAGMIEAHTDLIIKRWLAEVRTDRGMSSFTEDNLDYVKERVSNILFNLREWISYDTTKIDIGRRYATEGIEYFKKGIPLCESIRSFAILKRIIRSFALSECTVDCAYELYQMSEIYDRIIVFFDQANYYMMRGYTEEMSRKMKELWHVSDDDTDKIFFHKSFYNKNPAS